MDTEFIKQLWNKCPTLWNLLSNLQKSLLISESIFHFVAFWFIFVDDLKKTDEDLYELLKEGLLDQNKKVSEYKKTTYSQWVC